jgi:hypothetical protein
VTSKGQEMYRSNQCKLFCVSQQKVQQDNSQLTPSSAYLAMNQDCCSRFICLCVDHHPKDKCCNSICYDLNDAIPCCLGYYPRFEFDSSECLDQSLIQGNLLSQNKQLEVPILQVVVYLGNLVARVVVVSTVILILNWAAV